MTMRDRKSIVGIAVVTLLASALAGCGADKSVQEASAQGEKCTMNIGTLGPLSGPAADFGLSMKATADIVAHEVNQKGGVKVGDNRCRVNVVSYDTEYTSAGAAKAVGEFASKDVNFVIGPLGAVELTGMKPVAARYDMLLVANGFGRDALQPKYPLVFHISPGPSVWAGPIIREARKEIKFDSVTVVGTTDQSGTDITDVDAMRYREQGVEVSRQNYTRGTTDFAPLVTRIMKNPPDLVDFASTPAGDAGVMVKQLRQRGYDGAFARLGGESTSEIARVAGGYDVLDDFFYYASVDPSDPKVRKLAHDYEEWSGKTTTSMTYGWVPGGRALMRAITKAGTIEDTEKVAAALRKDQLNDPTLGQGTWTGEEEFGVNQEMSFPFYMGLIKNGKEMPHRKIESE